MNIFSPCEWEESPWALLIELQGKEVEVPSNFAFIQPLLKCIVSQENLLPTFMSYSQLNCMSTFMHSTSNGLLGILWNMMSQI